MQSAWKGKDAILVSIEADTRTPAALLIF